MVTRGGLPVIPAKVINQHVTETGQSQRCLTSRFQQDRKPRVLSEKVAVDEKEEIERKHCPVINQVLWATEFYDEHRVHARHRQSKRVHLTRSYLFGHSRHQQLA